MPRTAYCVVDHQTFAKRAAVMRAGGSDGEDVDVSAHQDHGLALDEAEQRNALPQRFHGNAGGKIGAPEA